MNDNNDPRLDVPGSGVQISKLAAQAFFVVDHLLTANFEILTPDPFLFR
jgi:hypothetical protein